MHSWFSSAELACCYAYRWLVSTNSPSKKKSTASVKPVKPNLPRRLTAEFLGTLLLVAAVVGSGIMAERLAGGNVALALLANTIATGSALVALILTFGSISGAHFNPVVSVADALEGALSWPETFIYALAQILGGIGGDNTVPRNVLAALGVLVPARQGRTGSSCWRIYGNFWPAMCDLGLFAVLVPHSSVCSGLLHNGGVLVHRVYVVRKSRGHYRESAQ